MTKPIPKEQQKKRGPKPKDGDASPSPSPEPSPSPSPEPSPVVSSKNPPLKNLVESVLKERSGNASQARDPKPRAKADDKKSAAKKADVETDPEMIDSLAGALAAGEGAMASFAVPAAQAEAIENKVSKMMKFAWKYHFIQNGINGFPSWAVLLVAHIGMGIMMVKPNMERITDAWNDFTGKVDKSPDGKQIIDHKAKPAVSPIPQARGADAEGGTLKKPTDPNALGG